MLNPFKPVLKLSNNSITLVNSGDAYFYLLLKLIREAKYVLHLQFYIFDLDKTGLLVLEELKLAVKRGVSVFVVVDAFGSEQITKKVTPLFTNNGIYIKRFSPIRNNKGLGLGRRLHHKLVWVDGHTALLGGINIADKYSGWAGQTPWLDFAVKIEGELCEDIRKTCDEILPNKLVKNMYKLMPKIAYQNDLPHTSRLRKNDWFRSRLEISRSYRQAFRKSEKSITIIASYFLLGTRMRKLIKEARLRGVEVTIILSSNSDVAFIKPATTYLYDWMLRNKINIYEWKKSILHGKLATADGVWTTVGSYNLNALSDYGSLEANVEIYNEQFAEDTEAMLQLIIQTGCEPVNEAEFLKNKNWILQFSRWSSYVIIRLALRILFGLMRVRRELHF